ncbi:MAG: sulfatase-like hydrolase/transferase [Caldilineaceae bacterium]
MSTADVRTTDKHRPNVIVFFTDQQRWDTTGVHGNPPGSTPNFDRNTRRGTDVHYTFTCQPVWGRGASCLQMGMWTATSTGVFNGQLDRDAATLAKSFAPRLTTATSASGIWPAGTSVPEEERGGYEYWLAAQRWNHAGYLRHDRRQSTQPRQVAGLPADEVTDAAIRYVDVRIKSGAVLPLHLLKTNWHYQNHRDNYPAPDGYEKSMTARMPPDLAEYGGVGLATFGRLLRHGQAAG